MNTTTETPTTIKGWLQTLPEPARSQAIANAEKVYVNGNLDEVEASSIGTALLSAFKWKTSPEGTEYWSKVLKAQMP